MDKFIGITAIALIIAYIVFAIWVIWKRESVWTSVGASTGLICGGLMIVPLAETIATFICWIIVIGIILAIIGGMCN